MEGQDGTAGQIKKGNNERERQDGTEVDFGSRTRRRIRERIHDINFM